jgi:hypothetical protein
VAAVVLGGCVGAIDNGPEPSVPGAADDVAPPGAKPAAGPVAMPVGAAGLPSALLAPVSGMRRLTSNEYDNTLRDLLGDSSRPSRTVLPTDVRTPFDNDWTAQAPSRSLVDGLDLLAGDAVQRLLADKPRRDALVGCTPTGPGDAACFRGFVARFGRRALRRPVATDEVARYEAAFVPLAVESGDFYVAVQSALEAFLQHLEVIYRVERGTPVAGQPGIFRLSDWELGTRLAFFLWGAPPDETLLDAAQTGALGTTAGVRTTAARMLKDARAKDLVTRFHALWLRYEGMQPASADLGQAMRNESAALIKRVVFDEQRPWQDIFRLTETFANDLLAKNYGLPAPGSTTGKWMSYGTSGRQGILSHGAFLSNGTKAGDTSPTMRGIAVSELLMCQPIKPPPPGVNADTPPQTGATKCKEDRYVAHRAAECAVCHSIIDPIGFGLENYDQLGRYRTKEVADPTCVIRGEGELKDVGTFKGPGELENLLLRTGKVNGCAMTQLYRYAIGRPVLDDVDLQLVALMSAKVGAAGGDFRLDDVMLELVSADSFRHRREEN